MPMARRVVVKINKEVPDRIMVSFPYDPRLIAKVKTIDERNRKPIEGQKQSQKYYPTNPFIPTLEKGGVGDYR